MAESKLTQQPVLTTPADGDLAYLVDVSDTSGGALGTSKQITVANLMTKAPVVSVNGETGVVSLDSTEIKRIGTTGDSIDQDLTAAENNINAIKAVLKYPLSTLTGLQVDTNNKFEIDSLNQKALFTINGTTAATIGPGQSLFPQVRIGTTGDTYDLPITRGTSNGEVPIYDTATHTSEWRTLQTSNLGGTSDGITQGTTNLFFTSAEQSKLAGIATGAEVNQNAFSNVAVTGQNTIVADSETDTLNIAAGSNMVVTTNDTTDTLTVALTNFPSVDGMIVGALGLISTGGNISATTATISGAVLQASSSSELAVATATQLTTNQIYFTGNTVSTIGPNNALPNDPTDLEIRSNGNVDIILDYDNDEPSQSFRVKSGAGATIFSVNEDGISVANGTTTTGAVMRFSEASNNGSNYVAIQAAASLGGDTTWTLPIADGLANQAIVTDGSGNLDWLDVPTFPQFMTGSTTASTSYTLGLSDAGRMIIATASSAVTVTVPTAASVAFPQDVEISFMQKGTGQITIAGASGVTVRTTQTLKTSGQYAVIAIKKIDTDEWVCVGDREAL